MNGLFSTHSKASLSPSFSIVVFRSLILLFECGFLHAPFNSIGTSKKRSRNVRAPLGMCTRATIGGGGGKDCLNVSDKGSPPEATSTVAAQRTTKRLQSEEDNSTKGARAVGDRIRDQNGFRRRAAAFCARIAAAHSSDGWTADISGGCGTVQRLWPPNLDALEVLMVSGRTAGDGYWVLPGGGVENMESTEEAVIRELREEAGIRGQVLFWVGEFVDDQRFHHTTLFFLTVREVFTEWGENCENGRQRRWMGMEEARQSIKHNQRDMLESSIKIIERTLGDQLEPSVNKWLSAAPLVSQRAAEDAAVSAIHCQQPPYIDATTSATITAVATSAPMAAEKRAENNGVVVVGLPIDGCAAALPTAHVVTSVSDVIAADGAGDEAGFCQIVTMTPPLAAIDARGDNDEDGGRHTGGGVKRAGDDHHRWLNNNNQ